jgi:hypothetical protein
MKVHTIIPTVLVKEAGIKEILDATKRFAGGLVAGPVNTVDEIFAGIAGKGYSKRMEENAAITKKLFGRAGLAGELTGRALVPTGIIASMYNEKDQNNLNKK